MPEGSVAAACIWRKWVDHVNRPARWMHYAMVDIGGQLYALHVSQRSYEHLAAAGVPVVTRQQARARMEAR